MEAIRYHTVFKLSQEDQTIVPVTCGTSFSRPDALGSLFKNLADGQTPTFLEMIAALSDVSLLVTPDGACPDCRIPA